MLFRSYDVTANPEYVLSEGVIQVNGFGDPVGNHRNIDPETGRMANTSAVAHKTYFGALPDVRIAVTADGNASVDDITADRPAADGPVYNLQGIPVSNPVPGRVYIRGGRKFIKR